MGSDNVVQMLGCLGKHGPYTFYKSIKVGERVYSLSTFMPVKIWSDSAVLSIADIQLLWSDKTESFCSLKLYFLPENTPDGRLKQHGEDEVIALQEKVVIRAADLNTWLVEGKEWDWGFKTPSVASTKPLSTVLSKSFVSESLKKIEKRSGYTSESGSNDVVVLTYPRYSRLRAVLKRLEGSPDLSNWLTHPLVLAIGGLNIGPNCRILYTKEAFEYPELEDHELLCNHLAPKLKGKRRRKKKRNRNPSTGSVSNESESSSGSSFGSFTTKTQKKGMNGITSHPNLEFDVKPDLSQIKVTDNMKRRNSISNNNPSVIGANSNGLQIMKIDPAFCTVNNNEASSHGTKRSHSQSNGASRNMDQSSVESPTQGIENENGTVWDRRGAAQLLGPALTELAQKLEKSNALQILPIRPSVIQSQDAGADSDNHIKKKRKKTDLRGNNNNTIAGPCYEKTGPYSSRPFAVGAPGIVKNSKSLQNHNNDSNKIEMKSPVIAHSSNPLSSKSPLMSNDSISWKQMYLPGASPCPYASHGRIYGDPFEGKKKVSAEYVSTDILNLTKKKPQRREKPSIQRNTLNVNASMNSESELLDLSARPHNNKGGSNSANNIFHNIADIPPPNAMNQLGLRLTSEVTLFPSHSQNNAISAKSRSSGSQQRHSSNNNSRNHVSSTVTNSHNNMTSEQLWKASGLSSVGASSSSHSSTMKDTLVPQGNSHRHQAGSSYHRSSQPSSREGQTPSKSNAGGSSNSRERQKDADKMNQQQQQQSMNPYLHPAYYGKFDPAYLSLLGNPQMFLPQAAGFMAIPGAMEQFYKDLLMQGQQQGLPSSFPNWFPPSGGKDRGPKS